MANARLRARSKLAKAPPRGMIMPASAPQLPRGGVGALVAAGLVLPKKNSNFGGKTYLFNVFFFLFEVHTVKKKS